MATRFTVTLSGDQEATPNTSDASGTGTVIWDAASVTAAYEFTIRGLDFGPALQQEPQTEATEDDVISMHFHSGARGVAGPVVFGQIGPAQDNDDLSIVENDDGSWTVSGIWEATDPANTPLATFAETLSAATPGSDVPLYFNVHTPPFPAGEIRGQLVAAGDGGGDDGEQPVDWNALAAQVLANFEATGQWFADDTTTPQDGTVDWNALAAQVQANFAATGSWFI